VKLENLPKGVQLVVEAAQNKKAGGLTVLDLDGLGAFTQYFVICTGYSTPQIQAILNEIEEVLYKELKLPKSRKDHEA
jgi:ribosome-associated protein